MNSDQTFPVDQNGPMYQREQIPTGPLYQNSESMLTPDDISVQDEVIISLFRDPYGMCYNGLMDDG